MIKTIAKQFGRTLGLNLLVTLTLGVLGFGIFVNSDQVRAERPEVATGSNSLMQIHQCWAGQAPAGAKAHHAVVSLPGGEAEYVGQRLTNQAIEQAVFGVQHHLTVYGFCR